MPAFARPPDVQAGTTIRAIHIMWGITRGWYHDIVEWCFRIRCEAKSYVSILFLFVLQISIAHLYL